MKILLAVAAACLVGQFNIAQAAEMKITGQSDRTPSKGPAANFTGEVTVSPLYAASEHTHNSGALVEFSPSARSAWHSHPAGQTLIVMSGAGWIQQEGGEKRGIKPGDVIWTPPGVKHWHGATQTEAMGHMAITNMKDGQVVVWMEKVTDAQYLD